MNLTEEMTIKYFRDAIALQMAPQVEIVEEAIKIDFSKLDDGQIPVDSCKNWFKNNNNQKKSEPQNKNASTTGEQATETIKVIVVLKTVNIEVENGVKYDTQFSDLTGVFFLPATLNSDGILMPDIEKRMPWIPRVYLEPVDSVELIVGKVTSVDNYISNQKKMISDINDNKDWKQYIAFAKEFWKTVNNTELYGDYIYNYVSEEQPLILDSCVYVMPDNTVYAVHHIKKLYEYSLRQKNDISELYRTIVGASKKQEQKLIPNSLAEMKAHAGQMNGSYPLSVSQREAVNHFNNINDGSVLAVNGPPGTGKTTLLQSIVADLMVKHALKEKAAPVIVATSTNNQAVTNIIESFAGTSKEKHPKHIDKHWIEGKESFATYFPSQHKVEEARKKGYQVTNKKMGETVADWEGQANKDASLEKVIKYCSDLFGTNGLDLKQCTDNLHQLLKDFDERRKVMLESAAAIKFEITVATNGIQQNLENIEKQLLVCQQKGLLYQDRLNAWRNYWSSLWLYRLLQFVPYMRNLLDLKMSNFRSLDEADMYDTTITMVDIERYYNSKINDNKDMYKGFRAAKNLLENVCYFAQFDINALASKKESISLCEKSLNELNELLDTNIRFYEFWLSVHYYECRWLAEENKVDAEELFKITKDIMRSKYRRLCLLSPCLVTTIFMLPDHFLTYKDSYLDNFIDLLIVDEAGQVSTELGAAAFLLAKKALVVGDIHQIEPVWTVPDTLDRTLATNRDIDLELSKKNFLSAADSSLMKMANKACVFSKYNQKGLLLTEHRRCYNELISYCNVLVYDGKLEPLRGSYMLDPQYPFVGQGAIEHIQIDTAESCKKRSSRYNPNEAKEIYKWLSENFDSIKKAYPDEDINTLIGIITPFKAQAEYIRKELTKFAKYVTVGTVHTFQGGERRIILFSTVYGANEGCNFIDNQPNVMNVAMSRAKDRFIVFGDIRCLKNSQEKPSGLLKAYLRPKH